VDHSGDNRVVINFPKGTVVRYRNRTGNVRSVSLEGSELQTSDKNKYAVRMLCICVWSIIVCKSFLKIKVGVRSNVAAAVRTCFRFAAHFIHNVF
jgi:uncharacterized membrane protein